LVASRSYVMAMRGRHRKEGYDFCDTPHCQTFRGMASVNPLVIAAGLAVQGEYLSHHGRVVPAFFHDNCGGETTTPKAVWGISIPYLRGVRDGPAGESYCRFAPSAHWEKFVSRTRLGECLAARKIIAAGAPLVSVQVVDRDASGRARVLALKTDHAIRVPVRKFQAALNDYFGG